MKDTHALLREVCKGCKYATETIGIAMNYTKDKSLYALLGKYDKEHEGIKKRLSQKISEAGIKESKHPAVSAEMAKLHMNMSLSISPTENKIAELMINGCNMGIKTVARYKNRHPYAAPESICLANELIRTERNMAEDLLKYLKE